MNQAAGRSSEALDARWPVPHACRLNAHAQWRHLRMTEPIDAYRPPIRILPRRVAHRSGGARRALVTFADAERPHGYNIQRCAIDLVTDPNSTDLMEGRRPHSSIASDSTEAWTMFCAVS